MPFTNEEIVSCISHIFENTAMLLYSIIVGPGMPMLSGSVDPAQVTQVR